MTTNSSTAANAGYTPKARTWAETVDAWGVWAPAAYRHATVDHLLAAQVLAEGDAAEQERRMLWQYAHDLASTPTTAGDLLLVGAVTDRWGPAIGAGKTHSSIAVCRPAVEAGRTVEAVGAQAMCRELGELAGQAIDAYATVEILLVDDLKGPAVGDTDPEPVRMAMFEVIDRRRTGGRPTIFTTNWQGDELTAAWGAEVFDRLWAAHRAVFRGPSRR